MQLFWPGVSTPGFFCNYFSKYLVLYKVLYYICPHEQKRIFQTGAGKAVFQQLLPGGKTLLPQNEWN